MKLSKLKFNEDKTQVTFWCIGCDGGHTINIGVGMTPNWVFNGDIEKPTFTPSVLVTYEGVDADTPDGLPSVCHTFVTNGKIQYLGDCTHPLANTEIDLPEAF